MEKSPLSLFIFSVIFPLLFHPVSSFLCHLLSSCSFSLLVFSLLFFRSSLLSSLFPSFDLPLSSCLVSPLSSSLGLVSSLLFHLLLSSCLVPSSILLSCLVSLSLSLFLSLSLPVSLCLCLLSLSLSVSVWCCVLWCCVCVCACLCALRHAEKT